MEGQRVIASFKAVTSPDVTTGVREALKGALRQSGVVADSVEVVALGTTHFTNAVVQRRGLAPTAAVRLGLPATQALPPMVDWPPDLRDAIGNHAYFAHGGHEFDGRRSLRSIPPVAKDREGHRQEEIRTTAILRCSARSTPNGAPGRRDPRRRRPDAHITLSSDIGRIGLFERENAAIMNACLQRPLRV